MNCTKARFIALSFVFASLAAHGVADSVRYPGAESLYTLSDEYPQKGDDDYARLNAVDEIVRGYALENGKKNGTFLLGGNGKAVGEDQVRSLDKMGEALRKASAVIIEIEGQTLETAMQECYKKMLQWNDLKYDMLKQVDKSGRYAESDLMNGYVIVRNVNKYNPFTIYRIDPKRSMGGVFRDVTRSAYHGDRNFFMRDIRLSVTKDLEEAAYSDPEYKKTKNDIAKTWEVQPFESRTATMKKEPSLFPELDHLNLQSSGQDNAQPIDLHSLDLDNPNGDWCQCSQPGCKADMDIDKGYVLFCCSVCRKVNVEYAKMALELEQRMTEAGKESHWYGPNAKENARKAAGK